MKHAPHVFRAASNGKPFTRNEKICLILNQRSRHESQALVKAAVAEEKARIAVEIAEREKAAKIRKFTIKNSGLKIKGVKERKDGALYFTPREGGKFRPSIVIA